MRNSIIFYDFISCDNEEEIEQKKKNYEKEKIPENIRDMKTIEGQVKVSISKEKEILQKQLMGTMSLKVLSEKLAERLGVDPGNGDRESVEKLFQKLDTCLEHLRQIEADYDQSLQVFGERLVELEFKKEKGEGTYNWPVKNYKFEFPESLLKKDSLYPYFKNKAKRAEFYWSSHTFTHENLDNASRSDVDNEIRVNIEAAKRFGFINDDNTHEEWWSSGSIITPQISGLRNVDAIEIFKKYGINSGTGDLSRPTLCNLENPYLPYYTTKEGSNYEGFPVIPRSPSEIYFHCSTSTENTWMYNQIYRNHFGQDTDWKTIIERESNRVLTLMMKLRHEAHQFHQANLRNADIKEHSLLQQWTDAIVEKYNSYVNWPMISLKLDDLAKTFTDRKEIEDCHASYYLITSDNTITGISVSATKKCTVPITVPFEVEYNSKFRYEQVGNDPLTIWVPLNNSKETIVFKKPFEWGTENPSIIKSSIVNANNTSTVEEKKNATVIIDELNTNENANTKTTTTETTYTKNTNTKNKNTNKKNKNTEENTKTTTDTKNNNNKEQQGFVGTVVNDFFGAMKGLFGFF